MATKCTATKNNGRPCRQIELIGDTNRCKYHQCEKFAPKVTKVTWTEEPEWESPRDDDTKTIAAESPTKFDQSTQTDVKVCEQGVQTEVSENDEIIEDDEEEFLMIEL